MSGIDISRIIELIADNPQIAQAFRSIAESSIGKSCETSEPTSQKVEDAVDSIQPTFAENSENTRPHKSDSSVREKKRQDLLCAIKPYVSEHRATAIDTVISLFDIINLLSVR